MADLPTGIVLAGGLGTRLRSVVADRPKPLAEVHGQPFLTRILDQLLMGGIREVVLATGYRGEQVRSALGDTYGPLRLAYSQEPGPLGTGGAVRLALDHIRSETVLVMNGDSYCGIDLADYHAWFTARNYAGALLARWVEDTSRYGRLSVAADGTIQAFEEKSGGVCGAGWINAGVYILNAGWLAELPADQSLSLERDVFPKWLGRGLHAYRVANAPFLDIGTPESYAEAEAFFTGRGVETWTEMRSSSQG